MVFFLATTTKQAFEENENEVKSNNEEVLDQSKSSVSKTPLEPDRLYEKAFFTINNVTVEVVLEKNILSWSTILRESKVRINLIFGRNLLLVVAPTDKPEQKTSTTKLDENSVDLKMVYAISPIQNRTGCTLNNGEGATAMTVSTAPITDTHMRGFQLHTYDKTPDNILQEILIIFQSISSDQIERWYQLLSKLICECTNISPKHTFMVKSRLCLDKPTRNVLVICNPHAGLKSSRQVYNAQIQPLLERARYNITYFGKKYKEQMKIDLKFLEINDHQSADEVLNDFQGDLESIYG